MSAVKKVVKGVVGAVKSVVSGAAKFVKKYWKPIVAAAAIVFTAGIATVGVAGFSSAMAAGGGGFAGFMSAAGSTMVAGAASIGGSIGIGSGVTASTAGGAFAAAPVMSGVAAGTGLTLGTGAAAQGLGLAASTYGSAAGTAAGAASGAAGSAGSFNALTGAGTYTGAGSTAANAGYLANAAQTGSLAGVPTATSTTLSGAAGAGATGAAGAAGATQGQGLLSTVLNSKLGGPLIASGINAISGYSQSKQQQELADQEWDREKPLSYWGVGARGDTAGGGAVSSPFQPGSTLTGPIQATNAAPAAPSALSVRPGNPPVAPNGNQGLMAAGWDINTGMPVDANGNPLYAWN